MRVQSETRLAKRKRVAAFADKIPATFQLIEVLSQIG